MGTEDAPGPCAREVMAIFEQLLSGELSQAQLEERFTPRCMDADLNCQINFITGIIPSLRPTFNCFLDCLPAELTRYNIQTITVPLGSGNALFNADVCSAMTAEDMGRAVEAALESLDDTLTNEELHYIQQTIEATGTMVHRPNGGCDFTFQNVYHEDDERIESSDVAAIVNSNSFKEFVVGEVRARSSSTGADNFSADDIEDMQENDVSVTSISVQASTGSRSTDSSDGELIAVAVVVLVVAVYAWKRYRKNGGEVIQQVEPQRQQQEQQEMVAYETVRPLEVIRQEENDGWNDA